MIRNLAMITCAALVSGLAACAANSPAMFTGGVLTNNAGMTLYTFDKDAAGSGKSVCNGPCARNWPPLLAVEADAKAAGAWTIIMRDDGSRQWAYKGKPVYLWVKDQRPGDRTGDGFNNAWRVIRQETEPMMVRGGY